MITGASTGLGAELAKAAIENGNKVVATFRKQEQADAFEQRFSPNGVAVLMDVTNFSQVDEGVKSAIEKFGRIDVLVNNAGYGTVGAIEEFSMEEIRAQMETNFFGLVYLTKSILPKMRQQGGGHILQMSSQAGIRAAAGFGVYNSSKFALEGFSEALAQEVAPFNIRIVIVEPGPFRTEFAGGSIWPAANKIEAYAETPVANTYKYIDEVNGKQEGDPVKAAHAILAYVDENKPNLRLPLGRTPFKALHMKIESLQNDFDANKKIAESCVFDGA